MCYLPFFPPFFLPPFFIGIRCLLSLASVFTAILFVVAYDFPAATAMTS